MSLHHETLNATDDALQGGVVHQPLIVLEAAARARAADLRIAPGAAGEGRRRRPAGALRARAGWYLVYLGLRLVIRHGAPEPGRRVLDRILEV